MSNYFYATKDGEFVSSTRMLTNKKYIRLSESEYMISRLVVAGYKKPEIQNAVRNIFKIIGK